MDRITLGDLLDLMDPDREGLASLRVVGPEDPAKGGLGCDSGCCLLRALEGYPVVHLEADRESCPGIVIWLDAPDREEEDE